MGTGVGKMAGGMPSNLELLGAGTSFIDLTIQSACVDFTSN